MSHSTPTGRCVCCGAPIAYTDRFCPKCGKKNDGWRIPGKNQCGNCHAYLPDGAKYCTICGTKAGEGAYKPYQGMMQCIYGPMPQKRTHVCENCGYSWTTCLMIDDHKYCPQCGGPAPVKQEEGDEISFDDIPFFFGRDDATDGSDSSDSSN